MCINTWNAVDLYTVAAPQLACECVRPPTLMCGITRMMNYVDLPTGRGASAPVAKRHAPNALLVLVMFALCVAVIVCGLRVLIGMHAGHRTPAMRAPSTGPRRGGPRCVWCRVVHARTGRCANSPIAATQHTKSPMHICPAHAHTPHHHARTS